MSAGRGETGCPPLSVCILSWNTRDLLCECLQAIFTDPQSGEWEVLVVDNASDEIGRASCRERV